ncbi:MAG: hypothetical protein V2A73_11580, partial [Pseudomonadota bacterium]
RPDDLTAREQANKYRILLETGNGTPPADAIGEKLRTLGGVRRVVGETSESGTIQFVIVGDGNGDLRRDLFRCAVDNHWLLLELERREASLEEVFARLTRVEESSKE